LLRELVHDFPLNVIIEAIEELQDEVEKEIMLARKHLFEALKRAKQRKA